MKTNKHQDHKKQVAILDESGRTNKEAGFAMDLFETRRGEDEAHNQTRDKLFLPQNQSSSFKNKPVTNHEVID